MKTEIKTIGPDEARRMLMKNDGNRPSSHRHVTNLAQQMRAGEWRLNAETIKLATDGSIVDGQHRLKAIVESGTPVKVMVAYDVPKTVFHTIDTGKKRNSADVLAINGVANPKLVGGAIRAMNDILAGGKKGSFMANGDVIDAFVKHPDVAASVTAVAKTPTARKLIDRAILAAGHYLFAQVDQRAADLMLSQLETGEGVSGTHPVHLLRQSMIRGTHGTKMERRFQMAYLIKTWNNLRTGSRPARLIWGTGRTPEPFPQIHGNKIKSVL